MIIKDTRYFDILFRDGEFAVVEDFCEAKEPGLPRQLNLRVRTDESDWRPSREYTYRNVEHEHVVYDKMRRKDACHNKLGELEPWYPELWQAEQVGKINEDPFEKQPPRAVAFFDYLQPVIELPGP